MLLITLAAAVWLATVRAHVDRVTTAATRVEALGGYVRWDVAPTTIADGDHSTDVWLRCRTEYRRVVAGWFGEGAVSDIEWIDLSGTTAGDDVLIPIGRLRRLRWLSLGGTRITDAGLHSLGHSGQLLLLDVSKTRVTVDGLMALRHVGLTQIDVRGTGLSPAEVDAVEQTWPTATVLTDPRSDPTAEADEKPTHSGSVNGPTSARGT